MSERIFSLERLDTLKTSLQVSASSVEEAFQKARNGEATEIADSNNTEYLIRDYPQDQPLQGQVPPWNILEKAHAGMASQAVRGGQAQEVLV